MATAEIQRPVSTSSGLLNIVLPSAGTTPASTSPLQNTGSPLGSVVESVGNAFGNLILPGRNLNSNEAKLVGAAVVGAMVGSAIARAAEEAQERAQKEQVQRQERQKQEEERRRTETAREQTRQEEQRRLLAEQQQHRAEHERDLLLRQLTRGLNVPPPRTTSNS